MAPTVRSLAKRWFSQAQTAKSKPSKKQASHISEDDFDGNIQGNLQRRMERLENEKKAREELEKAKTKPVLCALRTNIAFDGATVSDCPVDKRTVSFGVRDFLHIKASYNRDWWIGRIVKINSQLGFIPSPNRLKRLRSNMPEVEWTEVTETGAEVPNGAQTPAPASPAVPVRPRPMPVSRASGMQHLQANRQAIPDPASPSENDPTSPAIMVEMAGDDGDPTSPISPDAPPGTTPAGATLGKGLNQPPKKKLFKKNVIVNPYEVVPCMRPMVFVGPALKGYEVTDMMQKALFDSLKKNIEGRLIITRVSVDISNAKKTVNMGQKTAADKARNRNVNQEVMQEVDRIFDLASTMQLVVLDCDTINHPSQLIKSNLAPLIVYVKIASTKVLARLIKNRGKSQKKNSGVQIAAAERLLQCPPEMFDLVLEQNTLNEASTKLHEFLEAYWLATHPSNMQTKAERLLGMSGTTPGGGPKNARRAPPMDAATASIMSQLGVANQDVPSSGPGGNQCGNGDDEDDIMWGGDPEEYRSDREMRVDNKERTHSSHGQMLLVNIPGALAPDNVGGPGSAISPALLTSRSARHQKEVGAPGSDSPSGPQARRLKKPKDPSTPAPGAPPVTPGATPGTTAAPTAVTPTPTPSPQKQVTLNTVPQPTVRAVPGATGPNRSSLQAPK